MVCKPGKIEDQIKTNYFLKKDDKFIDSNLCKLKQIKFMSSCIITFLQYLADLPGLGLIFKSF